MANQIVFIRIARAAVDIRADLEGDERRGGEDYVDLARLLDIQRHMAIGAIEVFVGMAHGAGQRILGVGVMHGDTGLAGLSIRVTLLATRRLSSIKTLNSIRFRMVKLLAGMTVNTFHLKLGIVDVRDGRQFAHILASVTGTMAGVTGFVHGRPFLEAVPVEQASFGHRRPGNMA